MKQSRGAQTIVFPTPVFIVGTYDDAGKPNMMTAACGGICCSNPPCVSVSLRKATYTYGNIIARGAFTINIASEQYVKEADYVGMISGRDVNKFSTANLTPVKSELINAPIVAEFPMVLECKLAHSFDIGSHTIFVGEILDVKAENDMFTAEGKLDISKIKPLLWGPDGNGYFGVGAALGAAFAIGNEVKGK